MNSKGCCITTHVLSYQNNPPQEDFKRVPSWLRMPKPPLLACVVFPLLANKKQPSEALSVLNTQNHFTHSLSFTGSPSFTSRLIVLAILRKSSLWKIQFSR